MRRSLRDQRNALEPRLQELWDLTAELHHTFDCPGTADWKECFIGREHAWFAELVTHDPRIKDLVHDR